MGSPDNSPPVRPASVPVEARWDPSDPGFEWVVGAVDAEGRRHGRYRSWNRAGMVHGETDYDHGKVHGKNLNFHPDGTVASEAEWIAGTIMSSVFFRSDAPSPEPFGQAGPNVWSMRYYTRDGKTNYTIRYFTRDGAECGPDGNPMPPRPATVSPDARWFPDLGRWVDGEIARGSNLQVGPWRWWDKGGTLRHEELRAPDGEATMVADYTDRGILRTKVTRDDSGEQRDSYFDDGALSIRRRDDAREREIYYGSWLRDGSLDEDKVRAYDGDDLATVTERGRGGQLVFEARREGPAMACVLYAEDGKTIAATGLIADDKLHGTWRVLDSAGAVRREVDTTPFDLAQGVTGEGLPWRVGEALYRTDKPELATPEGLADVDTVPWAETAGAYCDEVDQFPHLLRALASADPLVRRYALGSIDAEVEHQGSTYPATARAIPYLARLLAHPNADRSRLLSVIQTVGQCAAPYVDQVADLDADSDERIAIEGTVAAVRAAWPLIHAQFASASPEDRRKILVIAQLAPEARPNLVAIARGDADPAMRACAVDALTGQSDYAVAEVTPCLADRDGLVRAAAAISIGCSKGPEAPREVVGVLDEALRTWRELAPRFAELPYTDGHFLAHVALAAGSVRNADARSLVQALCGPLDEVDSVSAVTYGQGLLALAFGRGDRPFAKRFVEILAALAASKQFWSFNTKAAELLGRWRLPRDQSALAALVAELKAARDPEAMMHAKLR